MQLDLEPARPDRDRRSPSNHDEVRCWLASGEQGLARELVRPGELPLAEAIFQLEADVWMRRLPGRETLLVDRPGRRLVVKRARGDERRERWYERLHRLPRRSPGRRECENLLALRADGLPVPRGLAWVERGGPSGPSAVVMEFVDHARTLRQELGDAPAPRRRAQLERLVQLVARLHAAGWYHRDLYLEHVVIERSRDELFLLDAGRARREQRPRRRWLIKDLAALAHSAPAAVTRGERLRFLVRWLELSGRGRRTRWRAWVRAVQRKRRRLAAHAPRHVDRETPSVPPPR